jgi:hypothetical protein
MLGFCLAVWASAAAAQIEPKLSTSRDLYLLYEPCVFTVSIRNVTNDELVFANDPSTGAPWLKFKIIRTNNGKNIRESRPFNPSPLRLGPGETKTVTYDLTPNYLIRESGAYSVQAQINLPGNASFTTAAILATIGIGDTLWKETRVENGTTRVYSLVRFATREDSALYLRIEEPEENVVYCTRQLGHYVSIQKPEAKFDSEGFLHILHPSGNVSYRYTRTDALGNIQEQENRDVAANGPILRDNGAGKISLAGGIIKGPSTTAQREKLSATQGPMGAAN